MTTGRRVAIIGCGVVGRKRAAAIGRGALVACADIDIDRARSVGAKHVSGDWREIVKRDDVDAVVISTFNSMLAEISVAAIEAGKDVLVEKPGARNLRELDAVIAAQRRSGKAVHVGFNLRFHPAVIKAREMQQRGDIGDMMFVRGRYGHGGRLGYDREWRADPKLSGGGELIDQGVHLIDLSRMFLGDFTSVEGFAKTFYWDMPVDDNAFLLLRTREEKTASLHVSCTEWKNLFSLEIYGRSGKLHIEGLGGSYGPEKLTHYRMLPEMGRPEMKTWEFAAADESWRLETAEFLSGVNTTNLDDARAAHVIVGEIYRRSGYESD